MVRSSIRWKFYYFTTTLLLLYYYFTPEFYSWMVRRKFWKVLFPLKLRRQMTVMLIFENCWEFSNRGGDSKVWPGQKCCWQNWYNCMYLHVYVRIFCEHLIYILWGRHLVYILWVSHIHFVGHLTVRAKPAPIGGFTGETLGLVPVWSWLTPTGKFVSLSARTDLFCEACHICIRERWAS